MTIDDQRRRPTLAGSAPEAADRSTGTFRRSTLLAGALILVILVLIVVDDRRSKSLPVVPQRRASTFFTETRWAPDDEVYGALASSSARLSRR